mmetsp:Transcript_37662/g.91482  ORF Transcript_37662/g.91482 Transcript_37662/m.91482 type:complete len:296 (-) Transcript_37662:203-1090(-)
MAPPSENKLGESDEGDEITPFSSREVSNLSLPSIGENYEGELAGGRVIEGKIDFDRVRERRQSVDSTSNFSTDSDDDVSYMTTESKGKRRSRKPRSKTKSRSSKRKSSSSGPSYTDVDIDTANRMLEEKDIVVSSLVKQIEELKQQLLEDNKKSDESGDVASEKEDLGEELVKAKRLLAEKEITTETLIEQAKLQQTQINEKKSVIEEQSREIARLKAKLAAGNEGEGGESQQQQNHHNHRRSSRSETEAVIADSKSPKRVKPKVGEGSSEKRDSKNKKKSKRSSKQSSSRKLKT